MIAMWPLSLWGHAVHATPSWHQLMNRDHVWMHEHYPLVALRYLVAAVLLVMALLVLYAVLARAWRSLHAALVAWVSE